MPPIAWLLVAVAAGVTSYLVGWPAWRAYRSRETRDDNTERYLAWRGRAVRGQRASPREGMTADERRKIYTGAALAALAIFALVAFFATS